MTRERERPQEAGDEARRARPRWRADKAPAEGANPAGPRLDQPKALRQRQSVRSRLDSERFGQASENLARYFGTAQYLVIQSAVVLVWILLNIAVFTRAIRWDPYPFILLNLAFSTQAAYAAPLILLAQNRQADRERVQAEQDRARDEQAIANTEYLLREVASLRMAVNDVATRDFLRSELQALVKELEPMEPERR